MGKVWKMWEKGTLLFCKLDSYHFKTSVFTFKRLFCFMSRFEKLTLFDMGGGGHDGSSKIFLTTVLKRLSGGSLNFVTFNINLWSIKKSYFCFPR